MNFPPTRKIVIIGGIEAPDNELKHYLYTLFRFEFRKRTKAKLLSFLVQRYSRVLNTNYGSLQVAPRLITVLLSLR